MSHVRTQVKQTAVTILTGLDITGSRVFSGQVYPTDDLPCLCISTGPEEVETIEKGVNASQERTITLVVEGNAKHATDVDTVLDNIQAEVETAIFGTPVSEWWIDLVSSDKEMSSDGEQETGSISMNFEVFVETTRGNPETAI